MYESSEHGYIDIALEIRSLGKYDLQLDAKT